MPILSTTLPNIPLVPGSGTVTGEALVLVNIDGDDYSLPASRLPAGSGVVVMPETQFLALYDDAALGPYFGKAFLLTDRAAGDGNVYLPAVMSNGGITFDDAYLITDSDSPAQPVSYDATDGSTSVRQAGPPVVGDLSAPNTTDVLSTQGTANALALYQLLTGFDSRIVSGTAAIGTGSKSVNITVGMVYRVGETVYLTNGTNWLRGVITSYNAGTGALAFTVDVGGFGGSGSLGTGARVTLTKLPFPTFNPADVSPAKRNAVISAIQSAVTSTSGAAFCLDSAATVSGDTLTSADYVDRYFTDTRVPGTPYYYVCKLDADFSTGATTIKWFRIRPQ